MLIKVSSILVPALLLSSGTAYANSWNTSVIEDEFTGDKKEVTFVEDSLYRIAIACGWGPRGSYYTPRILFKSKQPSRANPINIAWKIDEQDGKRGNYWHHSDGYYGPNYGNEGQRMKEISDTLVSEMKAGNSILVSMNNKPSSRLTLIGFSVAYNHVEQQCKDVYPKFDGYHTQRVYHKIN